MLPVRLGCHTLYIQESVFSCSQLCQTLTIKAKIFHAQISEVHWAFLLLLGVLLYCVFWRGSVDICFIEVCRNVTIKFSKSIYSEPSPVHICWVLYCFHGTSAMVNEKCDPTHTSALHVPNLETKQWNCPKDTHSYCLSALSPASLHVSTKLRLLGQH